MRIINVFWWLVAGVIIGLYLWSFKSAQLTWLIGGISTLISASEVRRARRMLRVEHKRALDELERTLGARVAQVEAKLSALRAGVPQYEPRDEPQSEPQSGSVESVELVESAKFAETLESVESVESLESAEPVESTEPKRVEVDEINPDQIEALIGARLLSYVGIGLLVLGLATGVAYSVITLGPLGRCLLGVAVGALLLGVGRWLEDRPRSMIFGRLLMGGGWALSYFIAYSAHHLEATRVFESPLLGALSLMLVVSAMFIHSLRYASELVTGVTLLIAHISLFITPISWFTLPAILALSALTLAISVKLHWSRLHLAGVIVSYLSQLAWLPAWLDTQIQSSYGGYEASLIGAVIAWVMIHASLMALSALKRARSEELFKWSVTAFNLIGVVTLLSLTADAVEEASLMVGLGLSVVYLASARLYHGWGAPRLMRQSASLGVAALALALWHLTTRGDLTALSWLGLGLTTLWVAQSLRDHELRSLGLVVISASAFVAWGDQALSALSWTSTLLPRREVAGGLTPEIARALTFIALICGGWLNLRAPLMSPARDEGELEESNPLLESLYDVLRLITHIFTLSACYLVIPPSLTPLVTGSLGAYWLALSLRDSPRSSLHVTFALALSGWSWFELSDTSAHIELSLAVVPWLMMSELWWRSEPRPETRPRVWLWVSSIMSFAAIQWLVLELSPTLASWVMGDGYHADFAALAWSLHGALWIAHFAWRGRRPDYAIGLFALVISAIAAVYVTLRQLESLSTSEGYSNPLGWWLDAPFELYVTLAVIFATHRWARRAPAQLMRPLASITGESSPLYLARASFTSALLSASLALITITCAPSRGLTLNLAALALALGVYGLTQRDRLSRIASLSLFGLAVLRLLALDIFNFSTTLKIITLIGVGIALLSVSFLYNQLRDQLTSMISADDESSESSESGESSDLTPSSDSDSSDLDSERKTHDAKADPEADPAADSTDSESKP